MTYVQPVLPAIVLLLGAAAVFGRRRAGRAAVWLAFLGLFLWSCPPIAKLCSTTLERRYPFTTSPGGDPEAIVVLAAGMMAPHPSQPFAIADIDTQVRTRFGAWLYKNWRPLPILVTGGPTDWAEGPDSVAHLMKDLLLRDGVPAESIWIEDESRSTYENALYSSRILAAKGIRRVALVTQGIHMPRSVSCFRKQGVDVAPAPCDLRSNRPTGSWLDMIPSADALLLNEAVLHEWIGLAWYELTGKI